MVEKGWWKEKITENIDAELMDICKQEAMALHKNVYEIDTTNRKPENDNTRNNFLLRELKNGKLV